MNPLDVGTGQDRYELDMALLGTRRKALVLTEYPMNLIKVQYPKGLSYVIRVIIEDA